GTGSINLFTGQGPDTINVQGLPAATGLYVHAGAGDAVVVGSDPSGQNGTTEDVRGPVSIYAAGGVSVVVDDSANPTPRWSEGFTCAGGGYFGDSTYITDGQTSWGVNIDVGDNSSVLLRAGRGDDRVSIVTPAGRIPVTIDGGAGVDPLDYPWSEAFTP